MSVPCGVCSDERCPQIDKLIREGVPDRQVGLRVGLNRATLQRHRVNHLGIRSADDDAAAEAEAEAEPVAEAVAEPVEPQVAFRVLGPAKFSNGAGLQEFRPGQVISDPWTVALAQQHGVRLEECEPPPTPDEVAALDDAEAVEVVADAPKPFMIGHNMVVVHPGQILVDQWQIRLYRDAGVAMRACAPPPVRRAAEPPPLPPAPPRFDAPKPVDLPKDMEAARRLMLDYPQILDATRQKCSDLRDRMANSGFFPAGRIAQVYEVGRYRASEAGSPEGQLIGYGRLFNALVALAGEAADPASLRFRAEQNAIAGQAAASAAAAALITPAFNPSSIIQLWASRGWNMWIRGGDDKLMLDRVGALTDADKEILGNAAKVAAIKTVIRNTIEI